MNAIPELRESDRVLVLAPHPDDETLGAGIALQQANAAGAAAQVVFATAGEANPWPQRWIERRWRLDAGAPQRWGARRTQEARAALARLGLAPEAAEFLGWPDGGIEEMLISDGDRTIARLASVIAAFRPTRVLLPSIRDHHPDHWALNLLARAASLETSPAPLLLEFLVHARRSERLAMDQARVQTQLDPAQQAIKLAALEAHQTQVRLNRGWLLRRARTPEAFASSVATDHLGNRASTAAIRWADTDTSATCLAIDLDRMPRGRSKLTLLLAGVAPGHVDLWRCVIVGAASSGTLTDCAGGSMPGHVEVRIEKGRDGRRMLLTLPRPLPGQLHYARVSRPRWRLQVVDRDAWIAL